MARGRYFCRLRVAGLSQLCPRQPTLTSALWLSQVEADTAWWLWHTAKDPTAGFLSRPQVLWGEGYYRYHQAFPERFTLQVLPHLFPMKPVCILKGVEGFKRPISNQLSGTSFEAIARWQSSPPAVLMLHPVLREERLTSTSRNSLSAFACLHTSNAFVASDSWFPDILWHTPLLFQLDKCSSPTRDVQCLPPSQASAASPPLWCYLSSILISRTQSARAKN